MQTVNWHLLQMRKSKRIGWYVSCFNAGGSESMKRRIDECASSVSSVMSACTYTCVQQVICHTVQLRSCLVLSSCTQWPTWYGTYLQLILVTSIIIHICRDDFNDKMRSTRKIIVGQTLLAVLLEIHIHLKQRKHLWQLWPYLLTYASLWVIYWDNQMISSSSTASHTEFTLTNTLTYKKLTVRLYWSRDN